MSGRPRSGPSGIVALLLLATLLLVAAMIAVLLGPLATVAPDTE